MISFLSLALRILGIVLTVWQTDQVRTLYANPSLYASSPGGMLGMVWPMVLVIILSVVLILHPQKGISWLARWILTRVYLAFAIWIDSDPELGLAVKRFYAATDKAKLLPEPTPPVK